MNASTALPALRTAAAFAALLLAGGSALSAANASAELSRAARYFQDGKAHRTTFEQTFTPSGFTKPRKESGELVVQAPENLRFDYAAPKKTFTFDGKVARFYTPADRQMTVRMLTEDERAQLPLVFLESAGELARRNRLDLEEGNGAASILVTPKDPASDVSWIRIALAADGSPASLSFQSSAGDRTEFRFGPFRTEPPLDASAFAIHPPAGTRIVENEP